MALRVALAAAVLAVIGLLALEMSGSAPRIADTNHSNDLGFVGVVPTNGTICQPTILPRDAARVSMLMGTYGHPVPEIDAKFVVGERTIATGWRAAGGPQGNVSVPLSSPHGPTVNGELCLHVHGHVAIGGEPVGVSPSSEQVNGQSQPGDVALVFLRPGRENWWQMLPTLAKRFSFGKAGFFGSWTLPLAALLLIGAWVATIKVLLKESW